MPAMSQREINCRGVERKVSEKSGEEKRNQRDSPSRWRLPFFVPHRSVSQRKRGQPMNREELRDKNYAAIKRDINTSCMCSSRRDLTSESRSRRNEDSAREKRPRDNLSKIKESL